MRLTSTLASGAIAQVAIDMMLMLGTYWLARKQWPWKACLIFGLCIVPLWGVKAEYRNLAWGSSDMSNFEKARAFVSLAGAGFKGQEAFVADSSETVIQRLDQTATFCFVLRLTPTIVPYWGGDSYGTLAWAVIPRFLYPDKPGKFVGQDFGHRYRLLSKQDDSTSYNCPQLVEMYANFGPWGVIFGMALLGLICRGIYYALSDPNGGDSTCMIALIIFTRLCDIESDFSMVFGGLLLNVAALVLAIRLLQARSIKLQTDALPGV